MRATRNRRFVKSLVGALVGAALALGLTEGCLFDVHERVAPDPDAASNAEPDVSVVSPETGLPEASDAGPDVLPNGCPAETVRFRNTCIDALEVTARDYFAFMRASAAVNRKATHPRCAWVTSWEPDNTGGALVEDNRPIGAVSWCQAWEYCKTNGKRLCGAPGTMPRTDVARPALDEWYDACTGGDGRTYCYGSTFSATACKSKGEAFEDGREPVGSRPTCEGGVPGLFDMGGNVAEWSGACDEPDGSTGENDTCAFHVASYNDYSPAENSSRCAAFDSNGRRGQARWIGFRCCATAL